MPTPAEFLRRMAPAQSHAGRRTFLAAAEDLDVIERIQSRLSHEMVQLASPSAPILAELHKLRDEAELTVTALLDILPVSGSWGQGYRVSDFASSQVIATHAEWVTAAWHLCCLHAILAGLTEPEMPASVDCGDEPRQTQAYRTEVTVDWHSDSIDGPALPNKETP